MTATRIFAVVILLATLPGGPRPLRAADEVALAARVMEVYEESVFLNRGSADGVQPGDLVIINGEDGRSLHARIFVVATHEARCNIGRANVSVASGATAQIIIPCDRPILTATDIDDVAASPERQASFQNEPRGPRGLQHLEVQVTAASGNSLYLDKGRADGLQPGDEVVLYPVGRPTVNATVANTSRNSSRCTILSGTVAIDVGTRGEALIPADRLDKSAPSGTPPADPHPDHPPWTQPPENWNQNQPLLAPPTRGHRKSGK